MSVALGITAIIAVAGIVATTAFIGSASGKRDNYLLNADGSIIEAEAASRALADGIYADGGEGEGNGSVVLFAVSNVSTKTATVSWGEPLNGVVMGYKVYVNDELTPTAVLESNVFEYTLTGLTYDTEYNVVVVSYNDNGESPAASLTFTTNVNPLLGFTYAGAVDGEISFTRGETSETFAPSGATFSVTSGTLPSGVTLNSSTGVITGPSDWGFTPISYGGSGDDTLREIIPLSDGGKIVAGTLTGTVTFGSTTLTSAGLEDVFVGRLDKNNNWLWVRSGGGTGVDEAWRTITTSDGGILMATSFQNTATFGTNSLVSAGSSDIAIVKISSTGVWQWATKAGGTGTDNGFWVEESTEGSFFVAGNIVGTATFGSYSLTSSGQQDIYVAKISPSGVWQWASKAVGTTQDRAWSLTVTSDGGAIVTGRFQGSVTFGTISRNSNGGDEAFVAKISSTETWEWAKRTGGTGFDMGRAIDSTPDGGAIVVGQFDGTTNIHGTTAASNGLRDIFVFKVDGNGDFIWATMAGGAGNDNVERVEVLPNGEIIIVGSFEGPMSLGSYNLNHVGSSDAYVAKLNSNGVWQWGLSAGSAAFDNGLSLANHPTQGVLVGGRIAGNALFGQINVTQTIGYDIFLAKVTDNGTWAAPIPNISGSATVTVTKGNDSSSYRIQFSTN